MALSVLLVLLHLSPVAVAAAAGKSPRGLEVRVEDGRLSVRLDAAPLETVLRMIAEQAGVVIKADGDLGEVRPQSFTEIPLIQGIRWLAGDRLLVMVYGKDRGSGSRLVEVRVYATRPENSAEASAKKSTMSPHIGALPVWQPDSRPAVTARYAELARLGRGKRLEEVSYLAYANDDEAIAILCLHLI